MLVSLRHLSLEPSVLIRQRTLQVANHLFGMEVKSDRCDEGVLSCWMNTVIPAILDVDQSIQELTTKLVVEQWMIPSFSSLRQDPTNRSSPICHRLLKSFSEAAWTYTSKIIHYFCAIETSAAIQFTLELMDQLKGAVAREMGNSSAEDCTGESNSLARLLSLWMLSLLPSLPDASNQRLNKKKKSVASSDAWPAWAADRSRLAKRFFDHMLDTMSVLRSTAESTPARQTEASRVAVLVLKIASVAVGLPSNSTAVPAGWKRGFEINGYAASVGKDPTCNADGVRFSLVALNVLLTPQEFNSYLQTNLNFSSNFITRLTSMSLEEYSSNVVDCPYFVAMQIRILGIILSYLGATKVTASIRQIIDVLTVIAHGRLSDLLKLQSGASTGRHSGLTIDRAIRGAAVVALSKACLTWDEVGRRDTKVLAGLVAEQQGCSVVRCNALVGLGDLAVNYSNLVDDHIGTLTLCLSAAHTKDAAVRRQSLAILGTLVANDYIKVKNAVAVRLLLPLTDPCASIRSLALSVFENVILKKHSKFVEDYFVPTMCCLNGWYDHPSFTVTSWASGSVKSFKQVMQQFSLRNNPDGRRVIYLTMLRSLKDIGKLETTKHLVNSFLGAFVDDNVQGKPMLKLPDKWETPQGASLFDALRLLSCDQIKITFSDSHDPLGGGEDGQEEGAKEKRDLEVTLIKNTIKEHILPTLLSLKLAMEDETSIFQKDVRRCIACILHPYRAELDDLLESDAQLCRFLKLEYQKRTFETFLDLSNPVNILPISSSAVGTAGTSTALRSMAFLTSENQDPMRSTARLPSSFMTALRMKSGAVMVNSSTLPTSVRRLSEECVGTPRFVHEVEEEALDAVRGHTPLGTPRRNTIMRRQEENENASPMAQVTRKFRASTPAVSGAPEDEGGDGGVTDYIRSVRRSCLIKSSRGDPSLQGEEEEE
eukprot:GHVH01007050.1.p1 GENE.GHVH01007050.1~~GHVH01007050.1.p1  ORF type:complete len:937 (+),score=139.61 GHVH01007050.1:2556-5366(+)